MQWIARAACFSPANSDPRLEVWALQLGLRALTPSSRSATVPALIPPARTQNETAAGMGSCVRLAPSPACYSSHPGRRPVCLSMTRPGPFTIVIMHAQTQPLRDVEKPFCSPWSLTAPGLSACRMEHRVGYGKLREIPRGSFSRIPFL